MAAALAYLKVPLTWSELLRRTVRETLSDNCLGMAAQLAYYFFFALFPALLFLIALASYVPVTELVDGMFRTMGGFVPPEALTIITDEIRRIAGGEQGGLLTFGMLVTLWTTSAAMTAIIETVNRAYDIEEGRPWWKVRITAIGLTVGGSLFILAAFALILGGPTLAQRLAGSAGLGEAFTSLWHILHWPVVTAFAALGIAIIYHYAPDADQDWVWLTPGSIVATVLWLAASLGFKLHVVNLGNYTATYGAIGGVMVLMLWLYISGLVILFGAEMNAEIEHASPYRKQPSEKVPGQRRLVGPAAMRAWLDSQKDSSSKDVIALPTPAPVMPKALPAARPTAAASWLIGIPIVAAQIFYALKALTNPKQRA